jgi:hypothetical protein
MPAINPAKLKIETAKLMDSVGIPEEFVDILHKILEYYSNRTRRTGQSGEPPPLIQTHMAPVQVIKQIERSLKSIDNPSCEDLLKIADTLWAEKWLESQLIAIMILGQIHPYPPDRIIVRIKDWVISTKEDQILKKLLAMSVSQLAEVDIHIFIRLLEEWLDSNDNHSRHVGLLSIPQLLLITNFDDLPKVFNLITPYMWNTPPDLLPELLEVIRTLAQRAPNETAYLLRQQLIASKRPEIAQLIRRSLSAFPHEIQEDLRGTLREVEVTSN